MYLRWNLFKDYCVKNNIQLLKDDFKFIERELIKIPENEHRTILKEYTDKWLDEVKKCENASQAQNLARRISNKWLLEEVKRKSRYKRPD